MAHPTIHLICNAHLDPVWQWRWEEGCAEALSTFGSAIDILNEHPTLIFNHNEAVLYEWVHRYDRAMFREIQRLVKKGRWQISGGWFLQPDVNLPGIESIIRHIAVGRQFFKKYFDAEPRVAYNFDSFGHSGGLPQVLLQAGYKMYIHMRPQEGELHIPSDLYRWKGVDGSTILTYRIKVGLYHTERDNISSRLEEATELALTLKRDVPVFWGIGNHGGGATREDLATIDAFMQREKRVRVVHSTPETLYAALRKYATASPIVEGDLQRVFTGCYTSLSRVKRRAARSLAEITQAETALAVAWRMKGAVYPKEEMEEIWRDHLFNDFHDILPGSCTEPAEADALDQYGRASESVRRLRLGAVRNLTQGVRRKLYIPVAAFNQNPSCTLVPLEAECMLDLRPKWTGRWHLRVYDTEGNEIPSQQEQPESLLPFNGWRRKVAFFAQLPSVGTDHYEIRIHEGDAETHTVPPLLPHTYDAQEGHITSLHAGAEGGECLAGPLLKGLVAEDDGDSWGADRWSYRRIVGVFEHLKEKDVRLSAGPVRRIDESVFAFNTSRMTVHTISYAAWPVLEFRIRLQWNETRRMLKLSVPTVFNTDSLLCEIPGGAIGRAADGEEHVFGRWCMAAAEGGLALGVVNNGQHGLDFKDGEIRLSILRSAAYCHEQSFALQETPARKFMDQGVHEVRILVTAGKSAEVLARLPGLADWVNAPPLVYAHLPLGDTRRTEFFTLTPETVRLCAMKQSWDTKAVIIRLQEAAGRETESTLSFPLQAVRKRLTFSPFEIKTLRLEKSGRLTECSLIGEV